MNNATLSRCMAEDEYFADVSLFTMWLHDCCDKASKVRVPFRYRQGDIEFDEQTIPQLVAHATFSSIEVAGWAMFELRARFRAEFAKPIEDRAAEIERSLDEADAMPDPDAWHDARVDAEMDA
jgi:hypothetical protein